MGRKLKRGKEIEKREGNENKVSKNNDIVFKREGYILGSLNK